MEDDLNERWLNERSFHHLSSLRVPKGVRDNRTVVSAQVYINNRSYTNSSHISFT